VAIPPAVGVAIRIFTRHSPSCVPFDRKIV
jgi:hypothetical protein